MLYAKAKIAKFVGASQPFKEIEKVEFFIYCVPLLSHPDVVLIYITSCSAKRSGSNYHVPGIALCIVVKYSKLERSCCCFAGTTVLGFDSPAVIDLTRK